VVATIAMAWPILAGLVAATAAFVPSLRGVAFAALAATHLVGLLGGGGGVDAAFLMVLPFAIDPGWFGAARGSRAAPDWVFYDGDCGLCHRAVRFLVAEDRDGDRFRFAPLGGGEAARRLGGLDAARALPDSIVILVGETPDRLLVRSGAVLRALDRLGGLWRVVAIAGRLVPRPLADALYDAVARVRKRLFAAPKAACPLIPPALRGRFILDEGPVAAPTDNRPGETPSPESPDGSPPRPRSPR
jgi:predicted DCC family thiol-disulfide oxidoreductase YuxK